MKMEKRNDNSYMRWNAASLFFVICLIFIATMVATLIALKVDAWIGILIYWIVLVVKNICDFCGMVSRN